MKRRQLLIAFCVCALAPASFAQQQPQKVRRIGFLMLNAAPVREEIVTQGLRKFGWIEGRNLRFEYRSAEGKSDRLPVLAEELVRLNVDLIIVQGTLAVLAAKNATRSIPIVIGQSADPVASGFVASLGQPGGNITGMSTMAPALAGKRLELLREIVPDLSRVAFLAYAADPAHRVFLKETQDAGQKLGVHVQPVVIRDAGQLQSGFSSMIKERAGGLIVQPIFIGALGYHIRIAELALKHRLPTITDGAGFVEVGGLIRYGPDGDAMWRNVATYADKILRGAKPAELPLTQPQTFQLQINLQTAKQLGLTIPQSVLLRADNVIN